MTPISGALKNTVQSEDMLKYLTLLGSVIAWSLYCLMFFLNLLSDPQVKK